jgi:predicted pyridoxine 5'-phosphate oxidase superfamily flavin-nucleotide-binding protein
MVLPYHPGELTVTERAGTFDDAVRNAAVFRPGIPDPLHRLLQTLQWFLLSGRDRTGDVWATALTGPPGFLRVTGPQGLEVDARPPGGDPLTGIGGLQPDGDPVGGLAIDLSRRLRARLNGRALATPTGLSLNLDQIYSNCMKYIQRRPVAGIADPPPGPVDVRHEKVFDDHLDDADVHLLTRADTFFLATAADGHGADVSHRGVPPGGIAVIDQRTLWFPDYPGNGMFNSFGNLELDPRCGLLIPDLPAAPTENGLLDVLQLSGRAVVEDEPRALAPAAAGRFVVQFTVERVVRSRRRLPVGGPPEYSPFLPPA